MPLLSLIVLLTLTACGYQLRGQSVNLSNINGIWVTEKNPQVANLLKQGLLENRVKLIDNAADRTDADTIISIEQASFNQSPSAYDTSGEVTEYQLNYRLRFTINEKSYQFNAAEIYSYDQNQLLVNESNRAEAEAALQQQAINFILRQLQY